MGILGLNDINGAPWAWVEEILRNTLNFKKQI